MVDQNIILFLQTMDIGAYMDTTELKLCNGMTEIHMTQCKNREKVSVIRNVNIWRIMI